jgi:chloramphenicol-sensitive protein RarD
MKQRPDGLLYGIAAYGLWGIFPIYWPLLEPAGAPELLAHRVVWSAVVMAVLVVVLRRRQALTAILRDRRASLLLLGAAAVISVNWGVYIWSVTHEHVVEASLGYFINPLVTVCMGVIVFAERLRPLQWTAVGIAAVAVAGLTWDYGRLPVVALLLAFSFGTYGLLRKKAGVGTIEGLTVETLLILPVALGYLVYLQVTGGGHLLEDPPWHQMLLFSAGLATAVPLLFFGAAAVRIPLTTIGLLQYIAPTLQFLLGITVGGEPMPATRLAGFVVIWIALALFTYDSWRDWRAARLRAAAEPAPAI